MMDDAFAGLGRADPDQADWLVEESAPWVGHVQVRALLPAGFEAYLRILPPAEPDVDGQRWRWPAIAAVTGTPLSAASRYNEVAEQHPGNNRSDPWGVPQDGILAEPELAALAGVLNPFTSTPRRTYCCIWEGWGDPWVQALGDQPAPVRVGRYSHHLFYGSIAAATTLGGLSPSMRWPEDRAWVLATDIDGYNTYLPAGAAASAAVSQDLRLDAVSADLDTLLDPSPWEPHAPQRRVPGRRAARAAPGRPLLGQYRVDEDGAQDPAPSQQRRW